MQLVILDRDGVINEDSEHFIKSPDEWQAIPGSPEAIARLTHANYRVVVATNQSGMGRGLFDIGIFNRINEKMYREINNAGGRIEGIFYCPHRPDEGCKCRKPEPGLLLEICRRLHCDLGGIPAIGDSLRDIEAARAVGARPILVRTGKGRETEKKHKDLDDVEVYNDLAAAVDALLNA
jgi:D-glycero-D-manno-heptose 1,7-bisphosphate phosphatase